jgi:hypothetical protein
MCFIINFCHIYRRERGAARRDIRVLKYQYYVSFNCKLYIFLYSALNKIRKIANFLIFTQIINSTAIFIFLYILLCIIVVEPVDERINTTHNDAKKPKPMYLSVEI